MLKIFKSMMFVTLSAAFLVYACYCRWGTGVCTV